MATIKTDEVKISVNKKDIQAKNVLAKEVQYFVWAWDDGYSEDKFDNGIEVLRSPALVTKNWTPFSEDQKPENFDELTQTEQQMLHITVDIDGIKYLVGRGAEENDLELKRNDKQNKHKDESFLPQFHAVLALMSKHVPENVEIHLNPFVMALPVAEDTEARRKFLRDEVEKVHHIEVELSDGTIVKRDIHIDSLLIDKQAFGAYFDDFLSLENGEFSIRPDASPDQFTYVVDIGAQTVNLFAIENKRAKINYSNHTMNGMFKAYNAVGAYIEKNYGFKVSDGLLPKVVRELKIGNVPQNVLKEQVEKKYRSLANDIETDIFSKIGQALPFVNRFLFAGGGATLLQEHIKSFDKLQTFIEQDKVKFVDRFATVRGLRKHGLIEAMESGVDIQEI